MGNSITKQTDRSEKGPTLPERHPLSTAFTDMPEMEFAALREDIRKRGVLEPIMLLDGKVLDGWHRYTAAREIDPEYEVPTVELGDRDPADFVLSKNLHRRHLTAVQRAVCVLQVRDWKAAGRPSADGAGRGKQGGKRTNRQLAEEAGCSVSVISAAKRQMRLGRGKDLKEGRESLTSLRRKDAANKPPTQIQKLRAEVAELREQNEAMASELEKLREAGRRPNQLALREENETLTSRVHLLEEKLRRAERGQKAALAQCQKMADRLSAAGVE